MSRPYHPPLTIAGQTYSFEHLEPFTMAVDSLKVGRSLRIHVRFSNHCFSDGIEPQACLPGMLTFPDGGGRPRVFSHERFEMSHRLPSVLRDLNHPKAHVWQTAQRRNWLHSLTVDSASGPYHVFFELRRAPADERHFQDLNLIVESAYPQGPGRAPAVLGKIGFVLLAGKIFKGEPAATRR